MKYENLNIYEASFGEVKEAVKNQYKNREIVNEYSYEKLTVQDWKEINKNLKSDLKEMGVKCGDVFYNPNNMRVYIKQKVWTETIDFWSRLSEEEQQETLERFNGNKKQAKAYWNEEKMCSSMQYTIRTNTDYYCGEDAEFFTVPAW